jgi:hypothetical protein
MYTVTIFSTASWWSSRTVDVVMSTHRLSADRTMSCPPKEVVRTKVQLGQWRRQRLASHPFSITWATDYAYLVVSGEKLCVYRMPLRKLKTRNGGSGGCGVDPDPQELPATPANEVVLPRSARSRRVQFFPGRRPASDGIVVVGPRDGDQPAGAFVIYLPAGSLGDWKPVDEASEMDISDESRRGREPLFEDFDAEDDCDLIPFDPNFNV